LVLNFNFLKEVNYELQLIKDGSDYNHFHRKKLKFKKDDIVKVDCHVHGRFVAMIKKNK